MLLDCRLGLCYHLNLRGCEGRPLSWFEKATDEGVCSSLSRSFEQTLLLELEMVAVSAIECWSNRAIIYHKRSDIVTLGLLVELWRVDLAVLRPLRDCTLLAQHAASSCRESTLI